MYRAAVPKFPRFTTPQVSQQVFHSTPRPKGVPNTSGYEVVGIIKLSNYLSQQLSSLLNKILHIKWKKSNILKCPAAPRGAAAHSLGWFVNKHLDTMWKGAIVTYIPKILNKAMKTHGKYSRSESQDSNTGRPESKAGGWPLGCNVKHGSGGGIIIIIIISSSSSSCCCCCCCCCYNSTSNALGHTNFIFVLFIITISY